ncbi:hypothetical protein SLEP1_g27220 [Rubroshorea leprosula]|uniref:DUF4219 domain-containing protein n=1 Tax=Rubroshorea leprosula TaxID=152421 RepID=A0AAV5JPR1_9ROSI|nr:hypothetical protein SLEP1_g27220 [Rubroshorea leprosula]
MSSNNSSTLSNPPMFTGENYSVWTIKMKAFLKAQEAWDTLKKEFDGSSWVKGNKIVTLKRQFEMLKMQETETVHQYTNKLMDVVNRIRLHGEEFPDRRVVEKIIVSVPDKFESKISAIEESCDLKELTITELISKLQAHEQRLVMKTDETTEGAFLARAKQQRQHQTQHQQAQYRPKQQQQVNYAKDQCKEDYLFTMSQGSSLPSSSWFVDSGCTNHMARDENFFIEMDK